MISFKEYLIEDSSPAGLRSGLLKRIDKVIKILEKVEMMDPYENDDSDSYMMELALNAMEDIDVMSDLLHSKKDPVYKEFGDRLQKIVQDAYETSYFYEYKRQAYAAKKLIQELPRNFNEYR